ncbi:TRC40/GET3/ArsA family transport-energizing ATPase [uncultured Chloroflexus sp.]|uniref:TRC40/GET3/ArsA family transport-energizing ATPase n=1 Tax=uncultured Chloroflexus sp. TaxID=214040 RepID=UPI0026246700|nr:TRC40/GET3/ArsA family transport-energizing ATPase [uncultured Chloroflexus sp.]
MTIPLMPSDASTQFIFFSGKGGVGKTSMACTHAVRYADEGKRTLIVTTDPASNLADVFEQKIGHQITPIARVPNLFAMEIDPDKATQEYIDRALAPIRTLFPPQIVQVMEEQMSGPCTAEIAAFDRFTDFLDAPSQNGSAFDVVIFDTAPTGHTIRLLELPAEWSQSIDAAAQGSGQTCIGPVAAIQDAKHKYERALAAMRRSAQTRFVFVLHPEAISMKETRRAIEELSKLGIHNFQLIVNGIIPPEGTHNPLFAARAEMQARYLAQIEREFDYPTQRMTLLAGEIKGAEKLRQVGRIFFDGATVGEEFQPLLSANGPHMPQWDGADVRVRLVPNGQRRTIFFAGKGGVGKTVASCVTAVWLARQGYKTLLLTTDPAAHLGDVLDTPVGDEVTPVSEQPNLWAVKIDPKATAEAYKARILDDARQRGRPESAIKVMEEELNSPCTEEIAAFDKFIEYASQDDWDVVVFDTAPTGHTLRLLELPVDWSKQIDVKVFASVDTAVADDVAKARFGKVIQMMCDPAQSTFAFVMYPESTPMLEAWRAAQELSSVGIHPGLVVANMVIPPEQATTPFVQSRRAMQEKYLAEIGKRFGVPVVQFPLLPHEVKGLAMLAGLGEQVYGKVTVSFAA